MKFLACFTESERWHSSFLNGTWAQNYIAGTSFCEEGNFKHFNTTAYALYFCHNLLIGNASFYGAHNLEGLEMKFQAHFIEGKGRLSVFL